MKITTEDKKTIVSAHKVHSAIGDKLKKNTNGVKDRVDLTDLAKTLALRRDKVIKEDAEESDK